MPVQRDTYTALVGQVQEAEHYRLLRLLYGEPPSPGPAPAPRKLGHPAPSLCAETVAR